MRIKGVIEKDKEYLDSGENPPKGVPVHTGPHQGKFYNTEDAEKIASPISGKEIMEKFNLLAGKPIGEVKEFLTNKVMDGELKIDDKDSAYSMAEQYIKEKGLKKSMDSAIITKGVNNMPYVMGIIKRGIPPGMRQAKTGEKADWLGPRGGKYKKIRQNETKEVKPIESGAAENEIKEYKTFGKDTISYLDNLQKQWAQDSEKYNKEDVDEETQIRVSNTVYITGLINKSLERKPEEVGETLFMCSEGGKVHGIALTRPQEDDTLEVRYLTSSPSIVAERERKGVGTALMYKIIKQAKEAGVKKIILHPVYDAFNYYKKIGFEYIKDKDDIPTLTMLPKHMDKFLSKFESKKITKAEGFMPYEFGEYDMSGVFKLEDLYTPLVANIGFKSGIKNKGINPDFRMYSNVKPAASDFDAKVPYERVGEIGNVAVSPRVRGIIEGGRGKKTQLQQPGGKDMGNKPKIKGIIKKSMDDNKEQPNKIFNVKIRAIKERGVPTNEPHEHVAGTVKVKGLIDKCIHPKIDIEKTETLKPPKGSTASALNQQNQALSMQFQAQAAKIGTSNAPMPVQKDFDNEFYKTERPPFDADDEREYYAEFDEPREERLIGQKKNWKEQKIGGEKENKIKYHNDKEIKINNERQNPSIEEKSDDPKEIKQRLLGNIQHFLEKYEEDNKMNNKEKNQLSGIKKNIAKLNVDEDGNMWNDEDSNFGGGKETINSFNKKHNLPSSPDINKPEDNKEVIKDINMFLKGYESLAYLGNELSDDRLFDIFKKAVQVNEDKNLNIKMNNEDRIAKIIAIDGVAHALHMNKNEDGTSQYKVLDDLAIISKGFGEKERDTRLIIMNNPNAAKDIEKLLKLEILQKSGVERSSKFWKLLEKAIKIGVQKLSDFELVALREWLYAKM